MDNDVLLMSDNMKYKFIFEVRRTTDLKYYGNTVMNTPLVLEINDRRDFEYEREKMHRIVDNAFKLIEAIEMLPLDNLKSEVQPVEPVTPAKKRGRPRKFKLSSLPTQN